MRKLETTSDLAIADGVLLVDDRQQEVCRQPMRKPFCIPVIKQSTHFHVGCTVVLLPMHLSPMGWRLELPALPGILMLGLPDARAPGAASGRTVKPGEEPPWYKPLLRALAQYLSVPIGVC